MKYSFLVMLVLLIALAIFLTSIVLSFKEEEVLEKLSPFECGFLSYEETRSPFSMQFFLVSLIFLVFDVELILMFPYLMSGASGAQAPQLALFLGFLLILSMGLFMEWEKTMLEWRK